MKIDTNEEKVKRGICGKTEMRKNECMEDEKKNKSKTNKSRKKRKNGNYA